MDIEKYCLIISASGAIQKVRTLSMGERGYPKSVQKRTWEGGGHAGMYVRSQIQDLFTLSYFAFSPNFLTKVYKKLNFVSHP